MIGFPYLTGLSQRVHWRGGKPNFQASLDRIGWLRAAVLVANDGIVSTASLIVGVAAAAALRCRAIQAGGKLARTWRRSSSGSVIPSEARTISR